MTNITTVLVIIKKCNGSRQPFIKFLYFLSSGIKRKFLHLEYLTRQVSNHQRWVFNLFLPTTNGFETLCSLSPAHFIGCLTNINIYASDEWYKCNLFQYESWALDYLFMSDRHFACKCYRYKLDDELELRTRREEEEDGLIDLLLLTHLVIQILYEWGSLIQMSSWGLFQNHTIFIDMRMRLSHVISEHILIKCAVHASATSYLAEGVVAQWLNSWLLYQEGSSSSRPGCISSSSQGNVMSLTT